MDLIVAFLYIVLITVVGTITYVLVRAKLRSLHQDSYRSPSEDNALAFWIAAATAIMLPLAIPVWVGLGLGYLVLRKLGVFDKEEAE